MPIKIGDIFFTLLVDLWSILEKTLATRVVESNSLATWLSEKNKSQLHTFPSEPIRIQEKEFNMQWKSQL